MIEAVPEEYRAAREAVIVAPIRLGSLSLRGPDRRKFLQGLLTADILALTSGGWTPSYLLTAKGRLVADLAVYDRGSEIMTLQWPQATQPLVQGLSKSIILSDTVLEDVSARLGGICVAGPAAGSALREVNLLEPAPGCAGSSWRGAPLYACAARFWGPGIVIVWEGAQPPGLEEALLAAAAGSRRGGAATLETLRVEAGVAAFGVDTDADTFPMELGEAGISFDKGCYLGQETTGKMKNRGHANRRLARLSLDGPAEAGAILEAEGVAVGRITSVARSPKGTTALGLIKLGKAEPGVRLSVVTAGALVRAALL